jgi:hypothetical protein
VAFKANRINVGSAKGGNQVGMAQLMAYMISQKKDENAKNSLPQGAIPTKANIGGVTYETPQASDKIKESLNNVKLQQENFKNLKQSLQSVPQGRANGSLSLLKSYITGGKGDVGSSSLFYKDNKPAMAVALYRYLTGDTRTSDADAASRALPLLPDQTEHPDLIEKKFNNIEKSLFLRQQLLETGQFQIDPQSGVPVTPQTFSSSIQTTQDPNEGKVIVNPTTGERKIRKGGQWLPI